VAVVVGCAVVAVAVRPALAGRREHGVSVIVTEQRTVIALGILSRDLEIGEPSRRLCGCSAMSQPASNVDTAEALLGLREYPAMSVEQP
jgi:hypothetical protein